MTDFDDDFPLAKNSPIMEMMKEDLATHSVEVLKARLQALGSEIDRTEQAITDKGAAKESAESFFK
ncbi:MAG: DUF1192 domain-containing protein [Emcibacter sp.]|nr:DUF1192 domain-containing protein [Emcibacter sp.]